METYQQKSFETALTLLGYDQAWLQWGCLEPKFLEEQIAAYHAGEDHRTEHFRYAAFRRILGSRTSMTDPDIEHYITLAERDPDSSAIGRSALIDLLEWRGLSEQQLNRLSEESRFAGDLFQKHIRRRRQYALLKQESVAHELFEQIMAEGDTPIQRHMVDENDLTEDQWERLAEHGVNRAIRNIAKIRLSRK